MKILIVNLLPLEYPYQVTKMKKMTPWCQIDYTVNGQNQFEPSDMYIFIVGKMNDQIEKMLNGMEKSKVILIVAEQVEEYHCWCIPKAFETEFDSEKLMVILGCIFKNCPEADLFQSYEAKICKLHRDPSLIVSPDHLVKGYSTVHLFIKDKVRRTVRVETHRADLIVHQHWIKGIESEIELLAVKRKS